MTDLTALALEASAGLTAAELHGVVCGVLAAHGEGFALDTLLALVGEETLSDQRAVLRFVEAAAPDLFAPDMRFQPLLPGDDESLHARAAGLAEWCGSFASGYGAAAGEVPDTGDEVGEILRDFVAISRLEEQPPEDDSGERDLVELIEFARVGALLLVGGRTRGDAGPGS